jgi:hypothetical protein
MHATREDLRAWVLDALRDNGGQGTVVQVAKHVWARHESELRAAGDLFYTWQYDIRWAATRLRHDGWLREASRGSGWELA